MPEIGTSGLMSGDGKRGGGNVASAPASILDSTGPLAWGLFLVRIWKTKWHWGRTRASQASGISHFSQAPESDSS